jgi:hypothetical protein
MKLDLDDDSFDQQYYWNYLDEDIQQNLLIHIGLVKISKVNEKVLLLKEMIG